MPAHRPPLIQLLAGAGLAFGLQAAAADTLTGNWGGLRQSLADAGLQFQVSYTGSSIEHVAGGFRRGLDSQGLLDVAVELDLEKASQILLQDYRDGALGRISLESPATRSAMIEEVRQAEAAARAAEAAHAAEVEARAKARLEADRAWKAQKGKA